MLKFKKLGLLSFSCLLFVGPELSASFRYGIEAIGNSGVKIDKVINGRVVGTDGKPIPGVSVMVPNSKIGTQTDNDGRFSLSVPDNTNSLRVYAIGFTEQNVPLTGTSITVTLQEEKTLMNEVVVVGYGTQLRRNIVGAVDKISGEVVENRSNAYLVRSLQGQVPGVNITMVDGKPSRSAAINIRGNTQSIGAGGSALILIDGIEGDITAMNPADVESISVLKDASSTAVYGARGAFGVVLVTTKKAATDKVSINYSGNFNIFSPTVRPQFETDSEVWYDNYKTAHVGYAHNLPTGINNFFPWSQAWEDEFKKRINDPDNSYLDWTVGNDGRYQYFSRGTNWYDEFYKDYHFGQQHNLSLSGGSKTTSFIVSGRSFEQDGIYRVGDESFRQLNLRAKGSIQLKKWLLVENNTDFVRRTYHQPMSYPVNLTIPRNLEHQGFPVTKLRNPDGTWTAAAVYTGYAGMADKKTYRDNFKYDMKNTTFVTANLIDQVLVAKADYTYLYNHSKRRDVVNSVTHYTGPAISVTYPLTSYMDSREYETEYYVANASLSYTPKLNENHSLNALGGWNVEHKKYLSTTMVRDGLLNPDKPNYSLMDGTDLTLQDGGSYTWGFTGLFYRLSYGYKGKYLFESSGRYDGSSKFPTNQQWGFFPSLSLGWRMSEEQFMKRFNWLDNLKWRFSIGSAGNGNVDPYLFMEKMTIAKSTGVITNGSQEANTSAPVPIPNSLTWEKSSTQDLGIDIDMFNGKINFIADIYRKTTTDMFVVGAEIPAAAGYSAPRGNNADMVTKGFEVALGYKNSVNVANEKLNYNVRLSLWDNKSKITKYTSKTNTLPTLTTNAYYEGMELGEIWGYKVDGLFATDAEAQAWGVTAQSKTFWSGDAVSWNAGDLRFADLNGDGIVDNGNNTLANHGDLRVIGNSSSRYFFGVNLGANWKGFGITAFFQGVLKKDWYPGGESGFFWGQYNRTYGYSLPWQNADRWTVDNPNPDAYWPRLRGSLAASGRGTLRVAANDRYLQDASYTRLKNLMIDYRLSNKTVKSLGMSSVRIYLSGENLFFWSPLKKYAKNFDPEQITAGDSDYSAVNGTDGQGYGYPQTKTISLGLNVSF